MEPLSIWSHFKQYFSVIKPRIPLKASLHHQLSDLMGNYNHLLPSGNIWANTSQLIHKERIRGGEAGG